MTHVFRESFKAFNYRAITPEVAAKELERIHHDRGTLKSQDVVDEARPKEAPLHPAFEWDDSIAGEQYRNIQARSLIKVVHIERSDETEPVYVNVNRQESAYEPAVKVVNTPALFEAAFSQACARLSAAQQSLQELQQLAKRERRDKSERYIRASQLVARARSVVLKG